MISLGTIDALPASVLDRDDAASHMVRLTLLEAEPGHSTTLDGAWWPRSSSLSHELSTLIADLDRRGVRITRVAYSPVFWDSAPGRIRADGRIIRLGWFQTMDKHLVSLTGSGGRLELLVIPPDAAQDTATAAMTQAARPGNTSTATAVLTAATAEVDTFLDE